MLVLRKEGPNYLESSTKTCLWSQITEEHRQNFCYNNGIIQLLLVFTSWNINQKICQIFYKKEIVYFGNVGINIIIGC